MLDCSDAPRQVWAVSQKRECVSKVVKVTRRRGVSLSQFGEAAFALRAGLRWPPRGRSGAPGEVNEGVGPSSFSALAWHQGASAGRRQQDEGGQTGRRNVG